MADLTAGVFAPLAAQTWALVEGLRKSVVVVHGTYGHGSGVIWESDGLIITNNHVVARDQAEVELAGERHVAATVIARDPYNDLAAIRVAETDLPAIPIGDSQALRVGELIIAVGHPFGVRGTATLGIVSGTGRTAWLGRMQREVVQADVVLAPGNSGGPLTNARGEVVGIASMIVSPGMALAVPSHVVRRFVATLPGRRSYIGVTVRPVELLPAAAIPAGMQSDGYRQGLLLLEVQSGSPAEMAGLLPGDVLVKLDGQPIAQPTDLVDRLAEDQSERPLQMSLLRAGHLQQYAVLPRKQML